MHPAPQAMQRYRNAFSGDWSECLFASVRPTATYSKWRVWIAAAVEDDRRDAGRHDCGPLPGPRRWPGSAAHGSAQAGWQVGGRPEADVCDAAAPRCDPDPLQADSRRSHVMAAVIAGLPSRLGPSNPSTSMR